MTSGAGRGDLRIAVQNEKWEHPSPEQHLYEGIYAVVLNGLVDVYFVPDVSALAPPWVAPAFAGEFRPSSPESARLAIIQSSSYAVTPNPSLAGRDESVPATGIGDHGEPQTTEVFYVAPEVFALCQSELAEAAGDVQLSWRALDHQGVTLGDVAPRRFIDVVVGRVLGSARLLPDDAEALGLGTP